jgi:glycosyltransferase involved in cell wall biosynthesis
MRVLLWHGWLLEGSGSNIYTARTAEVFRRTGHDVLLLCQEPRPGKLKIVDAFGTVGAKGVEGPAGTGVAGARGTLTLLRPEIGALLPVFVIDEYEGFERVVRFVDLTDRELGAYLEANVEALRAAAAWFRPDVAAVGHAVPGAVIGRRALGQGRYLAKVHGSDLEYAVKLQPRYLALAREGLEGAAAVVGGTRDVLERTAELVPTVSDRLGIVSPGVEVERFRPLPRRDALELAAVLLDADPDTARGRPQAIDRAVRAALAYGDAVTLDELARQYDQSMPDPEAADRLRRLASHDGPLIGYFGKLIKPKGVELALQALALLPVEVYGLVGGFGLFREWLTALLFALDEGDRASLDWLARTSAMVLEGPRRRPRAEGLTRRVTFTGRLDHRYAPAALAAMDVLVVPSILEEAFGMVAAEGAASGALPLVARHSGLAEVAAAIESAVDRPGWFSFIPGRGAVRRIAKGVSRFVALPEEDRRELRDAVSVFARGEWTWERTADRLLDAALRAASGAPPPPGTPAPRD